MADRLLRHLIAEGERPDRAVARVREQLEAMPWDTAVFEQVGHLADRWSVKRLALDLRPRLHEPDVRATLATAGDPNRPTYVVEPDSEIIVRRGDAADDSVTINGTTFRERATKGRKVVLLERSKLEEAWRGSSGYQPPGQHNKQALRFGDFVDVNEPVAMPRMGAPDDFRQGHKLRALSDRGFGVIPVSAPEENAAALTKAFGIAAPTQRAIASKAGQETVDARSWAHGIIGRGHSIERAYLANVDEAARTGQREGQSAATLSKTLRKQFHVAEARARFVARDRLGTLNASITRNKQTRAGFQFYRWLTSDDSRVRPEHAALHDTIRTWATPHPTEGHPGDAPGCRCVAVPATEDEHKRERKKNRGRAVAVAVLGVAAAGAAAYFGRRLGRRVFRPGVPSQPVPVPAAKPARPRPQRRVAMGGAQVEQRTAEIIQLPQGGRRVYQRQVGARWRYAHQLTKRIIEAEKAAGKPVSDYSATWWAAERAIRQAKSDPELMERLAKLAGDRGAVESMRKAARFKRGGRLRGKPRNLKRRRR